jgi:hypothetical protein
LTTLTVGAGLQFSTIAQAVAASHDNDVILIEAGTYKNDFMQINDSITLRSIGGMATIEATLPPSNRKGIITVGDGTHAPNVEIDGLVLTGATISAQAGNNAASIRYQSGNLTLNDDIIRNNQDGLLATPAVANRELSSSTSRSSTPTVPATVTPTTSTSIRSGNLPSRTASPPTRYAGTTSRAARSTPPSSTARSATARPARPATRSTCRTAATR